MKFKRFLVFLCFFIATFILFLPLFFGAFEDFNRIISVLEYEQNIEQINFDDEETYKEKFRLNFLKQTNGTFGILQFLENGEFFPICCNQEDLNFEKVGFFGEWVNDSYLVYIKNCFAFEKCFKEIEKLSIKDYIYFNFFGFNKCFVVNEVKNVYYSNQIEKFSNNCLTILVDLPYGQNEKILIRAKYLKDVDYEFNDFFSLIFKENYLLVLLAILILMFLALFIVLIVKFLKYINRKRNPAKIKYVKKSCSFN